MILVYLRNLSLWVVWYTRKAVWWLLSRFRYRRVAPPPLNLRGGESTFKGGKGEIIAGKYELGKTLGKGRFSKVKIALNLETGEQVAVKITERDQLPDPGMEEALRREVAVMRKLNHPNVVRLFDVYQTTKTVYLVLELVTGGELLDKIVHSRRFKEPVARVYFQQLILGLYFVHKNGIAHRDLKPENLVLDSNGNLKISDFGFSKQQISGSGRLDFNKTFCGTPEYISPDVLAGPGYNGFLSDIWSAGVVLFVMCSGTFPFASRSRNAMFAQILGGKYEMKEYFSPELKDLLSRILVVDPTKRCSMEDIVTHPWMQPMPEKELERVRNVKPHNITAEDLANAFSPISSESSPRKVTRVPSLAAEEAVETVGQLTKHRSFAMETFVEKVSNMHFEVEEPPEVVVKQVVQALAELNCNPENGKNFFKIKAMADLPGGELVCFNITVKSKGENSVLEVRRTRGSSLNFHQLYRDLLTKLSDAGQEVVLDHLDHDI